MCIRDRNYRVVQVQKNASFTKLNIDGNSEVFIGSADWMRRNLDRRVEAVTPIEDDTIKKEIKSFRL